MLSFLRFVVTGLLFLLSAAMLAKSLWVSWTLSITLIIVIALPSSRYPLLKGKRRWMAILLLLLALLASLHIEQEAMGSWNKAGTKGDATCRIPDDKKDNGVNNEVRSCKTTSPV